MHSVRRRLSSLSSRLSLSFGLFLFFAASPARAASVSNPTVGGPYDSLPTHVCSNLGNSYCYSSEAGSPLVAAEDVLPYMDNAARNWGCRWDLESHAPKDLGEGDWAKWYGTETDRDYGCGLVVWNYARQAAYFLANSDDGGTSPKLLHKYLELKAAYGVLGVPTSNPTPFGASETTYQQFAHGIITYVSGDDRAFHVGGAAIEDRALAAKYAGHFGVSPTSGPDIHGLSREVDCTNASGDAGCGEGRTGRHLEWWNPAQRAYEMIIARTGSATALYVDASIYSAWIGRYGATAPWNGALGFPISDLLPSGSATWHQEFEAGTILWEPAGCSAGPYTARVVPDARGPITESNLTILCESKAPENNQYAPTSAPVPFETPEGRGVYSFHGGPDEAGWYEGVRVQFDGAAPIEVNGPIYSAWIAAAGREGGAPAVARALGASAGGWGAPTGNATCDGSPCLAMRQRFANVVVTVKVGGGVLVGWAPSGVKAPTVWAFDRGYTNPPPPADPRDPVLEHRSGDFITLAWTNQSTDSGVTTRIYRRVTPLNGAAGPWTLIHTYPPPAPAINAANVFTDGPTNNATNCYALLASDGVDTQWSDPVCTFTLDGTTDSNNIDHSLPRGISRAQIRIGVPASPGDSGTSKPVAVSLVTALTWRFNRTLLDSTERDFDPGSSRLYDLNLGGNVPDIAAIRDVADIGGIVIESWDKTDGLRIESLELILDDVTVFSRTFDPPVLVQSSGYPGGTRLEIGFDELRSNPLWKAVYAASPNSFVGFDRAAFRQKLDSLLGHLVYMTPGAAYYGSRLRDDHHTSVTKPSGFQSDRLHVRQHIIADAGHGITCTLEYDLRLSAKDIDGNVVSPFFNGPGPDGKATIFTTEINLENPDVDCGAGFWKGLFYTLITVGGYSFDVDDLEDDIEQSLKGQAPSQIQSSPPLNLHFCFPGTGEGLGGPAFQNGGLTICLD